MSYQRETYGLMRWNGESDDNVYERCGMGERAVGVKCGELRESEFTTKVFMSEVEGPGVKGITYTIGQVGEQSGEVHMR